MARRRAQVPNTAGLVRRDAASVWSERRESECARRLAAIASAGLVTRGAEGIRRRAAGMGRP